MLTEQIPSREYETESQADTSFLRDPACDLDASTGLQNNEQTVSPESDRTIETETDQKGHPVDPRFVLPSFSVVKSDFKLLQLWEGRVDEVANDTFIATIFDKTNLQGSPEQVSISIEDVEPEDQVLLRPGAVFYWSIGYANYTRGPRLRTSRIRFRRLVTPRRKLIEHKVAAKKLADFFAKHSA